MTARKPEWARQAVDLYGPTLLARDLAGVKVADLGGAVARQASAFLAQQEAVRPKLRKRPFWLTEPCPDWCVRVHEATDKPVDRCHWSVSSAWRVMTRGIAVRPGENAGRDPYSTCFLRRCVGDNATVVGVQIGDGEVRVFSFTAEEARRFAIDLYNMALAARDDNNAAEDRNS